MGTSQPDETPVSDDEINDSESEATFSELPDDDELLESDAQQSDAEESDTEDIHDQGDSDDDDFTLADEDEEDGWEVDIPVHDFDAMDQSADSDGPATDRASSPKLPRGTGSVVAGVLSVLLSGLSLLPSFIAGIPATIVGAYALLAGYQTLGANRRNREALPQLLAPIGMLLGLIGIFAGPAYLNEFGDSLRNQSAKEVIESNFSSIHEALTTHAVEKGKFPAGGTFVVDDAGQESGMHSWITSLLPYLGYMEIYDSIDQSKSWSDEVNAPPLTRPIPTFLIPTTPHEPTARGLATTHIAGVGGLIQTGQGLFPTGIFGKNSAVRIDDITDGASQTMIAGEIARALPAWGNPENWRTIEGPLNGRLSSFGNAAGTGAHFLHADGSVRFYSNSTSPEVLQKLATRNAGD